MKIKHIISLQLMLFPVLGQSQASFLSNGTEFGTAPAFVTGGSQIAFGFRTPDSAYMFEQLTLNFFFGDYGALSIEMFSEASGEPEEQLGVLNPIEPFVFDNGFHDYSFVSDAELVFEANSNYFMLLEVHNPGFIDRCDGWFVCLFTNLEWSRAEKPFSGWAAADPGFLYFSDGAWEEPIFDNNYTVDIEATQIPEPITISLLIGAFVLLYAFHRRFAQRQEVDCSS